MKPRRRRGLLDFLLCAALLWGVYASTSIGALAETGIRMAAGQKHTPPVFATFTGRETVVDISPEFVEVPLPEQLPPPVERAADGSHQDPSLLFAAVRAHGECSDTRCSVAAPPALADILPDEDVAERVPLELVARALERVAPELDGSLELGLEALYVGPDEVRRAVALAEHSGRDRPEDVEVHAGFYPPGVRRGALQDALAVLARYRLVHLAWPVDQDLPVTSPFGERIHPVLGTLRFHNGVDIGAPPGHPLRAVDRGIVHRTSRDSISGNYVKIDHGLGIESTFCHMRRVDVEAGDRVQREQRVGQVGNTGRTTGPHLHYSLRVNGAAIDPLPLRPAPPVAPAAHVASGS